MGESYSWQVRKRRILLAAAIERMNEENLNRMAGLLILAPFATLAIIVTILTW